VKPGPIVSCDKVELVVDGKLPLLNVVVGPVALELDEVGAPLLVIVTPPPPPPLPALAEPVLIPESVIEGILLPAQRPS